jgi:hypothetical protein
VHFRHLVASLCIGSLLPASAAVAGTEAPAQAAAAAQSRAPAGAVAQVNTAAAADLSAPSSSPAGSNETGGAVRARGEAAPFRTQGIYLQQYTVQSRPRLDHLIDSALEVGVNTFVVDLWGPNDTYNKAVQHIQERGIEYIPRITMFPDGGTPAQVANQQYWEERWRLAKHALDLGAKQIQLDYIRYNVRTPASPNNALNIREVLRYFKKRVNERGARLQIDVFGEVALYPSTHIGQDMGVFATDIDAVCPMVYPSHYVPFEERFHTPYETVHQSLVSMKRQLGTQPVDVYAYIELFNYHYSMNTVERIKYIRAELRAVREAHAEGWIAWSAGNHYDLLFEILRQFKSEAAS